MKSYSHGTNQVQKVEPDKIESEGETSHMFELKKPSSNPIEVAVTFEGKSLTMAVDTGAAVPSSAKQHHAGISSLTYTDDQCKWLAKLTSMSSIVVKQHPLCW